MVMFGSLSGPSRNGLIHEIFEYGQCGVYTMAACRYFDLHLVSRIVYY